MSALIECAFCKGKGKDPFGLLSSNSKCQVCVGKGGVQVEKPIRKCVYCKGIGVYPHSARITCTVCGGKGSIAIKGLTEPCPECKGAGRNADSGLPCSNCKGKGLIA